MAGIRERIATYPLPFYGRGSWQKQHLSSLAHTLQQPQRTLVFSIIALTKVIIFSRWKKNTGMRLVVKYLLPCSAMFYMPFINSVKFIFATKEMSYESGRCKGVVLPQKERSRCQRELPCNGKVECRQVLLGGIQCENVGPTYDVALRSCYG